MAQLGGVHLACEQASNVLTKVLEWGRLMAYLEQSTRYIAYDSRLATGHYRYYRDPDVLDSPLGARYVGDMDRMFDTYGALLPELQAWLSQALPATSRVTPTSCTASRSGPRPSTRSAGCCRPRRCPTSGIYGTGQSYEMLLLRMRAHPLPEARRYADLMLDELRKVIPSFLQRVDLPDRGGVWSDYLADHRGRDRRGGAAGCGPTRDEPDADEAAGSSRSSTGIPKARTRSSRPCATRTRRCRNRRPWRRVRALGADDRRADRAGPTWASGRTAATGRAGPSSARATASTWSPTTAPSVTCSATGC